MKLWKDNKLDQEYDKPNVDIAKEFMASEFYNPKEPIGYNLVFFVSAKNGLSSTWEWEEEKGSVCGSPDMLEIIELVKKKERTGEF